ncbi:MAG: carbamoyl-phosphate synthase small subunit [Proteobacteria bacterium]|nr:MAG: carbamoyl-phosphate synthase small subunit [Pseudomonadota bacterium]
MRKPAILALEDGTLFHGIAIGAEGHSVGEVVFNTSMTGYQEILTDPSYARQIVTLTCPHIGNTGINEEDVESARLWTAGLIIRDLPLLMSNWRAEKPLDLYLQQNDIVGISEIDTRKLTRILREKGAQNGCIMATDDIDEARAVELARQFPGLKGMDLAKEVTAPGVKVDSWTQSTWDIVEGYRAAPEAQYHVVAYDFGVKFTILRMFVERGCKLTLVPATTPAEEVLAMNPDGVFLSNGPGDPEPCDYAISAIRTILSRKVPVFGICLGHQLLALASGAKTVKMKFGHHGANHPVQCLNDSTVMITSQNHGFAVDEESLPECLRATHRSLFDGSLQGIERTDTPAFGFQGHPEASPGPHDVAPLFDRFIASMEAATN